MKYANRRHLLSTALGLGLLACAVSPTSWAFSVNVNSCLSGPGLCATENTQLLVLQGIGGLNKQLAVTNTYLTTGVAPTATPGGLIGKLNAINEKLGRLNSYNDEAISSEDMAARQRMFDDYQREIRAERLALPSDISRACVQASRAATRAATNRGSGGGARLAREAAVERLTDTRPQVQNLIDAAINKADLGTCSQSDYDLRRAGCQGGKGDRPNADILASSLFDGGKTGPQSNLSIDEQGFKIGQQVISNIAPLKAATPQTAEQMQSEQAKEYELQAMRYNARAATVSDSLADILGFGVAMDVPGLGIPAAQIALVRQTWGAEGNKDKYEEMFGPGTFPAMPSEREMLRFEVFESYASVTSEQEGVAVKDDEIARKTMELAAINARINFALLERMEKQNALLAAMLAQQMDPLTGQALDRSYRALSSNEVK